MATSTEKNDFVGRAVAQVRDNYRNAVKRGEKEPALFIEILDALDEVKIRVRRFEKAEKEAFVKFMARLEEAADIEDDGDWDYDWDRDDAA